MTANKTGFFFFATASPEGRSERFFAILQGGAVVCIK